MSQYLTRQASVLGRTAALLYAVNTLSAALGALVAGFYLPLWFGFTNAYLLAVGLTGAIALAAWLLGGTRVAPGPSSGDVPASGPGRAVLPAPVIRLLAFVSGFVALSLEVLWTRMFAQVLQNSVYTFSTILVTFLVALALGAVLANRLIRRGHPPLRVLFVLLTASALLVGLSPFVFSWMSGGLGYLGDDENWSGYVLRVFGSAALVMLPPAVLLGSVFPCLIKLSEPFSRSAGQTVGNLAAVNTTGAILGALCAGFLFLDLFRLWASIRLMAAIYFLTALLIVAERATPRLLYGGVPSCGLLLLVSFLDTSRLPLVRVDPVGRHESVLEVWEGSAATVAVVLMDVFPLVTLWRGDFLGDRSIVALVGHKDAIPLDPHALRRRLLDFQDVLGGDAPLQNVEDVAPFLMYYGGNLTTARRLLDGYPLNTDDRPLIEYRAPITHRKQRANEVGWLVGAELMDFNRALLRAAPSEQDFYLARMSGRQPQFVHAGLHLHQANVLKRAGDQAGARAALREFQHIALPPEQGEAAEIQRLRRELAEAREEYERVRALEQRLERTAESGVSP